MLSLGESMPDSFRMKPTSSGVLMLLSREMGIAELPHNKSARNGIVASYKKVPEMG
jgi:hypothetical protein